MKMLEHINKNSSATYWSYWFALAFSSALSVANSMKHKQEEAHAHCFLLISLCVLCTHHFAYLNRQDQTPHGTSTFFEGQRCVKNFLWVGSQHSRTTSTGCAVWGPSGRYCHRTKTYSALFESTLLQRIFAESKEKRFRTIPSKAQLWFWLFH